VQPTPEIYPQTIAQQGGVEPPIPAAAPEIEVPGEADYWATRNRYAEEFANPPLDVRGQARAAINANAMNNVFNRLNATRAERLMTEPAAPDLGPGRYPYGTFDAARAAAEEANRAQGRGLPGAAGELYPFTQGRRTFIGEGPVAEGPEARLAPITREEAAARARNRLMRDIVSPREGEAPISPEQALYMSQQQAARNPNVVTPMTMEQIEGMLPQEQRLARETERALAEEMNRPENISRRAIVESMQGMPESVQSQVATPMLFDTMRQTEGAPNLAGMVVDQQVYNTIATNSGLDVALQSAAAYMTSDGSPSIQAATLLRSLYKATQAALQQTSDPAMQARIKQMVAQSPIVTATAGWENERYGLLGGLIKGIGWLLFGGSPGKQETREAGEAIQTLAP
jgi:hypothetical protein